MYLFTASFINKELTSSASLHGFEGVDKKTYFFRLIFCVDHVLNGFITGDFQASIIQVLSACTFGFAMAALRIHLNTLVPVIIFHWVWDFLTYLANPIGNMLMFNFELWLFLYAVWLLQDYLPPRFRYKENRSI
jgi:uncharacterized protein